MAVRLSLPAIFNQSQICELFGRDQSVISRHVRNVFKEGGLESGSNMQKMHIAGSDKPVALYSLGCLPQREATGGKLRVGVDLPAGHGKECEQWLKNYT